MSKPLWVRHDVTIAIDERVLGDYGGQSGIRDSGLADAVLAEAVRKGWMTPPTLPTEALPPRLPVAPPHDLLRELKRYREER